VGARAARLYGAAAPALTGTATPLHPAGRVDRERTLGAVRARLGEAAFTAARAEGQAMPLDQAVAYALNEAPDPS
jgi:hypothetical protein